jgi:hypothetical protein
VPIVISYDDPALVASLSANAARYDAGQNQRNVITRTNGSINDPNPALTPRNVVAAPQAQGVGGVGTIPVPDAQGGYTGGARIYYPEGTTVPGQEAAMTQQMIEEGARNKEAERQLAFRGKELEQRAQAQQSFAGQNRQRTESQIAEAVKAGAISEQEAAILRTQIDEDGTLNRLTGGVAAGGPTYNQQRLADKQQYDSAMTRHKLALDAIDTDVASAEKRLAAAKSDIAKVQIGDDGKAENPAEQPRLNQLRSELQAIQKELGQRLSKADDGGLYFQRRKARQALDEAASRPLAPGQRSGIPAAVQVRSKAEYDRLAPGQQYVAPDGTIRRKG